jgi:hypothetical protein
MELEKRYGRERWRRRSMNGCLAVVKTPVPPPRALPRVEVKMSISDCTP